MSNKGFHENVDGSKIFHENSFLADIICKEKIIKNSMFRKNLSFQNEFMIKIDEARYLIDSKDFTPKISVGKVGEILSHFEDIETSHLTQFADQVYTQQNYIQTPKKSKQKLLSKCDKYHLASGALAGALSRTFTAPLDRLKTIYQSAYVKGDTPNLVLGFKELYKIDGVVGLFKGNFVNVLKATPDAMIKFYVYEKVKKYFLKNDNSKNLKKEKLFIAGAISGICSNSFIFPLDVIKTRICAAPKGTYKGLFDTINKIYNQEGLMGFYRGLHISLMSVVPGIGLNLMIYELLKGFFSNNNQIILSMYMFMGFGAISSLISCTTLYPAQLLQTRVIMNAILNNYVKTDIKAIIQQTIKNEGIKGFYKGYFPAISKMVLGNAIGFGVYEQSKKHLINNNYFED